MKFNSKFTTLTTFALAGFLVSCSSSNRGNGQRSTASKGLKGARPSAQTLFNTKDLNKDGYLSYQEFQTRPGNARSSAAGKRTAPTEEMAKKRFALVDSNSDQRISLAELQAAPQRGPKSPR